jgi:hypothetical protein
MQYPGCSAGAASDRAVIGLSSKIADFRALLTGVRCGIRLAPFSFRGGLSFWKGFYQLMLSKRDRTKKWLAF